ncbi:MAG TPA: LLM class flavin-dependent oxidoreductase [Hyphomicrobiaceae bacterium]|nr:LLM class flavin-dependent oxidoreductase [Hyphomicrobiaceae bacterium]
MTVAIGLGLSECLFSDAAGYWRWVDMCEEGGVDSLWQTDRLVGPQPMLECMSVMAALAGRTRRIKFGMNVVSLALRDPVLVAKQCATIDFLSGGRLLPAFGIGSPLAPEWQALGVETRTRGRKTDEALDIISRLWREDHVDYAGRYFQLSGASIWPRPVQSNLPLWIGGGSDAAIRRTARIGTGWIAGAETPAKVATIIAGIRREVKAARRHIDDDHFGASIPFFFGDATDPLLVKPMEAYRARTGHDALAFFAVGTAETIIERIAAYVEAGVSKFILRPAAGTDAIALQQTRRAIEEVLPVASTLFNAPSGKCS